MRLRYAARQKEALGLRVLSPPPSRRDLVQKCVPLRKSAYQRLTYFNPPTLHLDTSLSSSSIIKNWRLVCVCLLQATVTKLCLCNRERERPNYVGSPHALFGAPFWHIAHAQGPPSIHPHRQHVPYTMPQQAGPAHRQHGRPQSTRKGKSQLLGLRTQAS